jgi:type III secretion protein L
MNTPLPPAERWLAVHHAPGLTLATRDTLIAPEQAPAFADCLALATHLAQLREDEAGRIAQATQQAQAQGLAEGRALGQQQARQEVAAALSSRLQQWAREEASQHRQLQDALVPLALLVVRRVCGELGAPTVLAALVRQAVQQVLDPLRQDGGEAGAACVVRLHPQLLEPMRERLGAEAQRFSCSADATLAPLDVVVETPSARVLAGLETQLQRVQAALAALPPAPLHQAAKPAPADTERAESAA